MRPCGARSGNADWARRLVMTYRIHYLLVAALCAACSTSQSEGAHTATPQIAAKSAAAPGVATAPRNAAAPAAQSAAPTARSAKWAQPLSRPGLPNLFKVSDGFYRGAQPTAEGIRQLPKLGVHTIVNLRTLHSDADKVAGLPLSYESISFKAWHPEHEDVVRFLKIVTKPGNQPIFVHCQHGADRTGMMTAVYRIVVQGWSKDDAIREMTQGGFGFHPIWHDLVDYVRKLDVKALRSEAGIPAPAH